MAGTVYLVGAGPGNYKLLTLRGKEVLSRAEVVIYDHLADSRLLKFAPAEAEFIYAGKKAQQHTLTQKEINLLLIRKAKENKTVVRLKGGDPFVFGRGGEEAHSLSAAHILFEIVPGITSAIAVPAYAGIPVTERGTASSFAVVTGHESPDKTTSSIRWEKLSTAVDTLIFLMGVKNLSYITEKLIANGRAPETPAALIRWGTKAEQKTLITTLENASCTAKRYDLKPPAIFLVGSVVNFNKQISWFENKPLFGETILITRTSVPASDLTDLLEDQGARCIELPTIQIMEPADEYASLQTAICHIDSYDWIVFTSINGVHAFFTQLKKQHRDSRALGHAKFAVIGAATKTALSQYGITADIIPGRYCAEELVEVMRPHIKKDCRILIPRARDARPYLPEQLSKIAAVVDVAEAYRTTAAVENKSKLIALLQSKTVTMITFTSSSTVENLILLLGEQKSLLSDITLACIGPITASTCRAYGLAPIITADTYTMDGLAKKIKEWKWVTHEV